MPTKRTFRDEEIEYYFERRRYGSRTFPKFYCWIIYRIMPNTNWHYAPGDPFPKVTPNKKEMAEVLADIRKRELADEIADIKDIDIEERPKAEGPR
jgi:hypothetical protein